MLSYNEVLNALTTSLEEDLPAHQETMSVLEANHYRVAGELEAWRNHLQTQINDMYKKYKEKLRQVGTFDDPKFLLTQFSSMRSF